MQSQSQSNFSSANQFYDTRLGSYDDILSQEAVSPHWQKFLQALNTLGGNQLEARRLEGLKLLRENGVTYTVYSENNDFNRPWQLDPVPLLISATEWQLIEQGLKQRVHLLDLILKDIYGEQLLLKKGLLPAELIFAHQGYLLPCMGSFNLNQQLTLYAANLARGPNGRIWVLNDHTQAPSGIGYCLENRNVITSVMADLFQQNQVQRYSTFFNQLQISLAASAPHNKDDPHIVVLTPGSRNETYFEHAYLASQLGFTLAQGDDLTVRDERVWLRTLEGLQPVDVLLRRVDDNFCDPLELYNDSRLGVTGLLQAVRNGNISIANALGSSVLENQGLLAFLPGLSRYFLNEELLLPSVATWWCGHKKERDFVLKNLARLTIKQINRGNSNRLIFGNRLDNNQLKSLAEKIQKQPYLYIGQEQITFSTVPSLVDGKIEARNAVIRCFAVAGQDDYQLMPGGLTRVASHEQQIAISNQYGAVSKDTWVLGEKSQADASVVTAIQQTETTAISEPLSSRAADNLFWVGRQFERVSSSVRLLRVAQKKQVNYFAEIDESGLSCLTVMLKALTHLTGAYPGFCMAENLSPEQQKQEILSLLTNSQRHGSIAQNIDLFFQAALNIRDLWSQDTWRSIDEIHEYWRKQVTDGNENILQGSMHLVELSTRLAAFSGLTAESMTRESGWRLLQLGQKIEQALSLIAILRTTAVIRYPEALTYPVLEAILLTMDSLSIYQRRYRSRINLQFMLELLLQDKVLPHSLCFQLQAIHELICQLPDITEINRLNRQERLAIKAYTDIRLCNVVDLLADSDGGVYRSLDNLLAEQAEMLVGIAEGIAQTYFNHVKPVQQLMPSKMDAEI